MLDDYRVVPGSELLTDKLSVLAWLGPDVEASERAEKLAARMAELTAQIGRERRHSLEVFLAQHLDKLPSHTLVEHQHAPPISEHPDGIPRFQWEWWLVPADPQQAGALRREDLAQYPHHEFRVGPP